MTTMIRLSPEVFSSSRASRVASQSSTLIPVDSALKPFVLPLLTSFSSISFATHGHDIDGHAQQISSSHSQNPQFLLGKDVNFYD